VNVTEAAWWTRLTEGQKKEIEAWRKAHRWHPNQLRHLFVTVVRKAHGLEAAQVLRGHTRAEVTQVYAERNAEPAARVADQVG
jgi:site-specific recombinase XerC